MYFRCVVAFDPGIWIGNRPEQNMYAERKKVYEKPTTLKMINYSRIKWIGNAINK